MRLKNALAKFLYVLIILFVLAVTVSAVSFYIREELSNDRGESILIGGEMEVYAGQTARLNPSLVDKDGKIIDAVFDYSTDSEVIRLDSLQPGTFRADGYADDPQIIRITERKTGASAEVSVTIVSEELNDIVEASLEEDSVQYGDTMRILVRTIPKNCDFSSYYTLTVSGEGGAKLACRGGAARLSHGRGAGRFFGRSFLPGKHPFRPFRFSFS